MLKLKLQYLGHLMQRTNSEENLDTGKDWRQEENGTTEDEMAGRHHWLNGHEFEQTLGDSEGQGSLTCCSPWGHKETRLSDWTKAIITKNSSDISCKEKYVKVYLHWLFFQNEFSHFLLYKLNSCYTLNPESSFCLYTGKFLYQCVCKLIPFKVCLFLNVNLLALQAPVTGNGWWH